VARWARVIRCGEIAAGGELGVCGQKEDERKVRRGDPHSGQELGVARRS
jgi:hypothetical protein